MCEFQRGKTDLACRELALKPVPVTMFLLAHPSCRFCYTRDMQGLLHTKLLLKAANTLLGIAMAPRRTVV